MRTITCLLFVALLAGCTGDVVESNLQVDHVNVWVKNPRIAKEKLTQIGFTGVPDSLCLIHEGQGTTGRYFYFLDSYLEFIFIYDEEEFAANAAKNKALDFIERSNSPENGYLPFSIALSMEEHHKERVPFDIVEYTQDWMGENNAIYAAKNSKLKPKEPSLFIVYPEIKYDVFESMEDLSSIPEDYAIWREFYKHSNGAEKISKIKIYTTELDRQSKTVKALKEMENVELVVGDKYLMELYFDDQRRGKVHDLRPEIPLVIYL